MMRDQRAALDRAMQTLEGSGNADAAEEEASNSSKKKKKKKLRSKGQTEAQLSDAAHVMSVRDGPRCVGHAACCCAGRDSGGRSDRLSVRPRSAGNRATLGSSRLPTASC